MFKFLFFSVSLTFALAAHADITAVSNCSLVSGQDPNTFALLTTTEGYEVATGSSEFATLTLMGPSETKGWPNYGGSYYKGGNDMWVIISPKDTALPSGVTFKVIKPLETDVNTGTRPSTYMCSKSM